MRSAKPDEWSLECQWVQLRLHPRNGQSGSERAQFSVDPGRLERRSGETAQYRAQSESCRAVHTRVAAVPGKGTDGQPRSPRRCELRAKPEYVAAGAEPDSVRRVEPGPHGVRPWV